MFQTSNKTRLTICLLLLVTTFLSAQRLYNTRLFYPTDTSISVFYNALPGSSTAVFSDSSLLTQGVHNSTRTFSRFDKRGALQWTRIYQNDTIIALSSEVTADGGMLLSGIVLPVTVSGTNRLFLTKLAANGTTAWTRIFKITQPTGLTTNNFSNYITVSNSGAILVHGAHGANASNWHTYVVVFNANGVLQKAWSYTDLYRTAAAPTRDGGFIVTLAAPLSATNGNIANMRLLWLQANGEVARSAYYTPIAGMSIGSTANLLRVQQTALPDSSVVVLYGSTVTRFAKDGAVIWSNNRQYQATSGINFNVLSTLINATMTVSSRHKIYTMTGLFETNLGLGREIPVINEYDLVTGNLRARAYPDNNVRISSITEIADGSGFWVTADTIIPRGTNMTKTIAGRVMRADTAFNAGCGAPVALNSTTSPSVIQLTTPAPPLTTLAYATEDYSVGAVVAPTAITIYTKGECPNSLVKTDDVALSKVTVFPNPSYGDFTIESPDAPIKSIQIFDLAGKLVQKLQNEAAQYPLSIEQAGAYFLDIETTKGRVVKKVIKIN